MQRIHLYVLVLLVVKAIVLDGFLSSSGSYFSPRSRYSGRTVTPTASRLQRPSFSRLQYNNDKHILSSLKSRTKSSYNLPFLSFHVLFAKKNDKGGSNGVAGIGDITDIGEPTDWSSMENPFESFKHDSKEAWERKKEEYDIMGMSHLLDDYEKIKRNPPPEEPEPEPTVDNLGICYFSALFVRSFITVSSFLSCFFFLSFFLAFFLACLLVCLLACFLSFYNSSIENTQIIITQ
jgi:hypothetical protein